MWLKLFNDVSIPENAPKSWKEVERPKSSVTHFRKKGASASVRPGERVKRHGACGRGGPSEGGLEKEAKGIHGQP